MFRGRRAYKWDRRPAIGAIGAWRLQNTLDGTMPILQEIDPLPFAVFLDHAFIGAERCDLPVLYLLGLGEKVTPNQNQLHFRLLGLTKKSYVWRVLRCSL